MIGIYLRSSTSKQDKGLDAQKRAIEAFLDQKGYTLKDCSIYEDSGFTGSKIQRPALSALLNDVRSNNITKVYCYSFSRISRSIRDLIDIVEELENYSVEFHSLSENVDTSTPMGRCFLNIIASLNQAEREILQERTKNGLKAAIARGVTLGRKKTRNSMLIQELRKKGYSYRQIAKLANCSIGTISTELNTVQKETA